MSSRTTRSARARSPRLNAVNAPSSACSTSSPRRCKSVSVTPRMVVATFITPIDEGDILLLASSLDDVVDLAEETADKIDLYRIQSITDPARQMGEYLARAGVELAAALDRFEGFGELQPHRLEIHRLENEGDQLMRTAIGDLSPRVTHASELDKRKDIYDLLEATMDACEHTANVMETIAIKNA